MFVSIAQLVIVVGAVIVVLAAIFAVKAVKNLRRDASRGGYPSVGAYLSAVPRSDEEKKAAVDLALKGLMICLIGLFFPPLFLIGLFPLFFGARKLAYSSMGLGLVNDAPSPVE